jgi:signal transduction histidine kinase
MPALRHLYLLPTLWAAFSTGAAGGRLSGLAAGILQAPLVLPAIEATGLTAGAADGLVGLLTPLAAGWVVGSLRDRARLRAARLDAVLEMQRQLARDGPLLERLQAVARRTRIVLGAERVALVVAGDPMPAVASDPQGARLEPGSAAAQVLRDGRAISSRDLAADPRFLADEPLAPAPRRGLVLALESGAGIVGALAVEWPAVVDAAAPIAAREMAMHLAAGIENARLALRQRRFAIELEDKVAAATRRLRELDQAKSDFLSVVSHELRTPLTALQGFSELLLARDLPPAESRRCLRHLRAEAERLARIVGDLLDLSRIEAGLCGTLRREPVDVAELVRRNLELFEAGHPQHRFVWRPETDALTISADPDSVDRILKNLLSNAAKYSPRGGRVVVSAGRRSGLMVEIAVQDEGVGIPAEALPRIFDKYVRVPDRQTRMVRGLGLGLAVVKALCEAQGGSVGVESRPGQGSRFQVLLPALREDFS